MIEGRGASILEQTVVARRLVQLLCFLTCRHKPISLAQASPVGCYAGALSTPRALIELTTPSGSIDWIFSKLFQDF
jgi:hypothetical protein